MARPAGFEPTTPWFVAKYSIQLSYGRCKKKNIAHFLAITQIGKIFFNISLHPKPLPGCLLIGNMSLFVL